MTERAGPSPSPTKRAAERRGRRAEALAALWLRLKGYRILARNHRSRGGEVDLVAARGRVLVFAEVKARATLPAALDAVSDAAAARISAAAHGWADARPKLAGFERRFDLVAIRPWRLPTHMRNAWRG